METFWWFTDSHYEYSPVSSNVASPLPLADCRKLIRRYPRFLLQRDFLLENSHIVYQRCDTHTPFARHQFLYNSLKHMFIVLTSDMTTWTVSQYYQYLEKFLWFCLYCYFTSSDMMIITSLLISLFIYFKISAFNLP